MTKEHKAKILLNGEHFTLTLSHRSELSKDSITNLRHFLESVGVTPDKL